MICKFTPTAGGWRGGAAAAAGSIFNSVTLQERLKETGAVRGLCMPRASIVGADVCYGR